MMTQTLRTWERFGGIKKFSQNSVGAIAIFQNKRNLESIPIFMSKAIVKNVSN